MNAVSDDPAVHKRKKRKFVAVSSLYGSLDERYITWKLDLFCHFGLFVTYLTNYFLQQQFQDYKEEQKEEGKIGTGTS